MDIKNSKNCSKNSFNALFQLPMCFLAKIGEAFINMSQNIGKITIFIFNILCSFFGKLYWKELIKQMISIGFFSIPVIAMTSVFGGLVLALQTYSGFQEFATEASVAKVLVIGTIRELCPVLTGLMFAGRVASSIAAEVGTMVITEQVDAIRTFNINPLKYLVIPRLLAAILVMPFLVVISNSLGILGGYLISTVELGLSKTIFLNEVILNIHYFDIFVGLLKSIAFGISTTCFGCYYGFASQKGSKAVGESTIRAVVATSISVLVFNYVITLIFFGM